MSKLLHQIQSRYPLILSQDVIWGDMDAYGHVNNIVYFRYFEDARMAYFEKVGVGEHKEQWEIGPILAATHCNYRLPLDYPDRIHIATRASILSPKKINLEYVVFSESRDAVVAEGESLVVYYDYANGKSCEVPEEIVAAIRML